MNTLQRARKESTVDLYNFDLRDQALVAYVSWKENDEVAGLVVFPSIDNSPLVLTIHK
ncbi:hypothetical protein [Collimonas sp.]|uniref:hypothetical protein n=1 Tax=Collimonas sp. TaxID=1963772 RepID=UPI002BAC1A73|nr:hypothetical protein [Collimonas sp.]HWX00055.1 hypothetical protein [Collimonas sp.]